MRALVLNFATLEKDPRVFRQIEMLLELGYEVTALSHQKNPYEKVEQIPLPHRSERKRKLLYFPLRCHSVFYWNQAKVRFALDTLQGRRFDLIIANDADTLPLAKKLKGSGVLLFDAHEFAPAEWEESFRWRALVRPHILWCLEALDSVDRMSTICEGIRKEYLNFCGRESAVISNACRYSERKPKKTTDTFRMVYTGIAHPGRYIEEALQLFQTLPSHFHLDLYLMPADKRYLAKLRRDFATEPRLRFLEPVPMEQLVETCAHYDIGYFPLPIKNRNVQHGLPNKFFEFIQARLCLAVSPLPEMKRLIEQYRCGVSLEQLRNLTKEQLDEKKEGADRAAKELNLEKNSSLFAELLKR